MKRVQEISACHKDMQNVRSQIHLRLHPLNVLHYNAYMDFYLILVAPSSMQRSSSSVCACRGFCMRILLENVLALKCRRGCKLFICKQCFLPYNVYNRHKRS